MEDFFEEIKTIQPVLEARRIKFQRIMMAGIILFAIVLTFTFMKLSASDINLQLPVVVGTLLFSLILFQFLNSTYKKTTKAMFVKQAAKAAGLSYTPNGVFSLSEITKHKILPHYDRHRMEDGFRGEYKGVPIEFQEVVLSDLERDPNNKDRPRELLSFWGMIVRFKLHKPVEGHTVIIPCNFLETFFRSKFSSFQRVKLVSNKFEATYNVISTDQVEARVILNPAFMERFMEAGKTLKSRWVEASFLGNEIVFIIEHRKPLFEIGPLWRPLTEDYLAKTANEINAILHIIDILKINPQVSL